MRNGIFLILYILIIGTGCKQKGNSLKQVDQAEDSSPFFQVSQYIQQQIEEVKRIPYFIYRIDIIDSHKDSVVITTPIFEQLAQQFLKSDISKNEQKKDYVENIFHDQTTKTFTISYSTLNKELEVQNIDILLQEDGRTVKRIFLRKFYNYPDSSVIEQLSWKADEDFRINRVVQIPGKKEKTQQTIVVWNEKS